MTNADQAMDSLTTAERRSPAMRGATTAAQAARPQPHGPVRRVARLVADVWRKADRDRILGLAAENAFMAVLTLFPTLLVFAATLGQLGTLIGADNAATVENNLLNFLRRVLTSSADGAIETARGLFDTNGNALTIALVLALASSAQAFAGIVNTVTLAYDVRDRRGWWKRRWIGLLLATGSVLTGTVLITAIVIGPLFGQATAVVGKIGLSQEYAFVWAYIRYLVAFLALIAWATTLFHICADRPGRWRSGLWGGFLTALLWLAASVGFSYYLQLVVPKSPVLGALGGGLILMTWFYLLTLALLIGAELNAVLLARRSVRLGASPNPGLSAAS